MLSLALSPGEYFVINENIVVQYDNVKRNQCHLAISAPREVPILRGTLYEKSGGKRPECLFEKPSIYHKELPWNLNKALSLSNIRKRLDSMEDTEDVRFIRAQLEQIFSIAPPRELTAQEQAAFEQADH